MSAGRSIRLRTRRELRANRRRREHPCWDHVIAAPLWPLHGASLNVAVAGSLVLYKLAGLS